MKLSNLHIGQSCVIRSVGGEDALRTRLLDMGLTPNTRVLLRHTAPMGDPFELRLRSYSLSLRREDAQLIEVEVVK